MHMWCGQGVEAPDHFSRRLVGCPAKGISSGSKERLGACLPMRRDTRAAGDPPLLAKPWDHPGAEVRRRRLWLELGISLPCQVVLVDVRIVCTLVHRS